MSDLNGSPCAQGMCAARLHHILEQDRKKSVKAFWLNLRFYVTLIYITIKENDKKKTNTAYLCKYSKLAMKLYYASLSKIDCEKEMKSGQFSLTILSIRISTSSHKL